MSKTDDTIIVQRISKLINYVDNPEELADRLDEIEYFNNKRLKKTELLQLPSQQASKVVT